MSNRIAILVSSLPLAVLIGAGCMGWWWWSSVDADRPSRVLAELRDREQHHADDCAGWKSRADAGDEPDRYVDDVYLLTDDMLDGCDDLMGAGRIGRNEYDRIDDMHDRLRISVDGHRARFDIVVDVDAMQEECTEHHLDMIDLLDETELRLQRGGMMGGGGMMR